MKNPSSTFSFSYLSASLLLHALAVTAILLAPQLKLLDEGSGHTIEFVAMEPPKGEQLQTPTVAEKEVVAPPEPQVEPKSEKMEVAAPLPKLDDLMPKQDKLPEQLDNDIAKEEPKKEIATVLPDKEEVSEPAEEKPVPEQQTVAVEDKEDKYDEFLADDESTEEAPSVETETQTAALVAIADTEPKEDIPNREDPATAAIAESSVAKEDVGSEEAEKPAAPTPAVTKTPAQSTSPSAAQTDASYGKPSGTVRSYLDLKQVAGNRPPQYPTIARRNNQQGQVKLAYYVQSNGSISNMKLVQSSGHPLLDQEAVRAVSQFRYQPGQPGWTIHPVDFKLQGPVKKMPSRLRTSGRAQQKTYN